MKRKIVPLASVIILSLLVVVFFYDVGTIDKKKLESNFVVDAIYDDNASLVSITYHDKMQKTNSATLEILGMENSFQKTFFQSDFNESVPFESKPKYGWQVHPVTILVEHEEFGRVGIKTEIHESNEQSPQIIFSSP
jgi:hypothetical protein